MMRAEVEAWRQRFPITERCAYLNHAVVGPLPRESLAAIVGTAEAQACEGSAAFGRLEEMVETVRSRFARLIAALPEEVALARSTSAALSLVAGGLSWRAGDSVVLSALEFPANVFPWMNLGHLGVQVRSVPAPTGRVRVDDLLAAVDSSTRVVAVSMVQFSNGYRADIEALGEFCRERGVLLVVDGMQAVGVLALDVHRLPIDALATASHKWVLGPWGVGWLYVRRDLLQRIRPISVGMRAVTPRESYLDHTFTLRADARRFEDGVPNLLGISAAGASLQLLAEAGMERIESRVLALADRLAEGLAARDYSVLSPRDKPQERSGIVTFSSPRQSATDLQNRLIAAGIMVSVREGAVRAAPHFYNTEEEIDQLLEVLAS